MSKSKPKKKSSAPLMPASIPKGANDKINHAIIGLGSMGQSHLGYVFDDPQARLVGLCDVYGSRVEAAKAKSAEAGQDCRGYRDFREMIDSESIDVMHVVTPPHWHALQCIYALNAGCDVWAEKPMTRTIGEGVWVVGAVQRNSRVFRLNTWFRMHSKFYGLGTEVAPLKKLIQSGALGWPLTVRLSAHTGFAWKASMWMGKTDLPPEPVPEDLDYELWLGPAPWRPYNSHRCSGSFRGYWDYDGGGLADMGQHYLDPVQYLLDKDDTSPVRIEANAPWPQHPDAVGIWGQVYMEYADGCKIILESCEWGEEETKGKPFIEGPGGKVYKDFRTEPGFLAELAAKLPEPEPQISDFNVSVRSRKKFALNEKNGFRSNILVHLANCAIRSGRRLTFTPLTLEFENDFFANSLLNQPMRPPWCLL